MKNFLVVVDMQKDFVDGSQGSKEAAGDEKFTIELVGHLDIKRYEVNIKDAIEGLKAAMPLELSTQSLTNMPPRIRMTTLYAVSQSCNGRVVNAKL